MALNDTAQLHSSGSFDHARDPVTIAVAHNTSFNILKHVGSGMYGHVFHAECRACEFKGALRIVPAVASENTDLPHTTDRHVRREVTFHNYLNMTNPYLPHVVRALNGWKIENVSKSEYLNWHKKTMKSLIAETDYVKLRIKENCPDDIPLNIFFIFMPYYHLGNLRTWLQRNPTFSDANYDQRLLLFRDILTGVEFLHKKDLIHRRLYPDNILLGYGGQSRIRAVVGGLGRITSYGEKRSRRKPENMRAQRETIRELFDAPEVRGTDYDQSCDYYSIGIIALQLFWNLHTYADIVDAVDALQDKATIGKKQDNPDLPQEINGFWLNVVKNLVSRKRQQRPSCSNLLEICARLGYQEMRDSESESVTCETLKPTNGESSATFYIASADNARTVSTSSSTASLPAQSPVETPLSSDELTKWSLPHSSCNTATQANNSVELNINSSDTTIETNGTTNMNPSNVKSSEMTTDSPKASDKKESGVPAYFQKMTEQQQRQEIHAVLTKHWLFVLDHLDVVDLVQWFKPGSISAQAQADLANVHYPLNKQKRVTELIDQIRSHGAELEFLQILHAKQKYVYNNLFRK